LNINNDESRMLAIRANIVIIIQGNTLVYLYLIWSKPWITIWRVRSLSHIDTYAGNY